MARNRIKQAHCANCNFPFGSSENYCPQCGQENHAPNQPFKHLLLEVVESAFHIDTKFFNSARYLLLNPGRMTREFLENKRARFMPPARLYILVSAIFFVLFQTQIKKLIKSNIKDHDPFELTITTDEQNTEDSIDSDSANLQSSFKSDSTKPDNNDLQLRVFDIPIKTVAYRDSLLALNDEQLKSFFSSKGEEITPFKRRLFYRILELSKSEKSLISQITIEGIKYFSLSFILLMPFFGLLLQLAYIRHSRNYYEHFIFSIHYHIAFFSIFSLGFIFTYLGIWSTWPLWFYLLMTIYLIFSIRENYRQSWMKTILKSIFVILVYTLVLAVVMAGAGFYSFLYT